MQMKMVKRPLQRISNVPRMLAPETSVVDSVGRVHSVEKVEAEARLAVRDSLIIKWPKWREGIVSQSCFDVTCKISGFQVGKGTSENHERGEGEGRGESCGKEVA
jgi:hypothetical protein